MSTVQRQTASRLLRASARPRASRSIHTSLPTLAASDSSNNSSPSNPTTQTPPKPVTRASRIPFIGRAPKAALPSTPYTVSQPPQFPAPNDPFFQPSTTPGENAQNGETATPVPVTTRSGVPGGQYSDTTKAVVRGLARAMGYNSKASTAIRETGRMMRGIVESIERDRVYWYEECGLPPTYQTFFQLHLLYVLILLPRLRALAVSSPTHSHPIPEPLDPSSPHHPRPDVATSTVSSSNPSSPASAGNPMLGKPDHDAYPSELLNHFFELAESEMRKVLGRGERERVVKKYMAEMGEQWKGAGAGLDYVMGLDNALSAATGTGTAGAISAGGAGDGGDVELASWVWRNLYASQGLTAGPGVEQDMGNKEVEMVQRLEEVVRFVRREMARLDSLEDAEVLDAVIGEWGSAKQ